MSAPAGLVTPEMRATQTQALHDALDALLALGLGVGFVENLVDSALDDALERAGLGAELEDDEPARGCSVIAAHIVAVVVAGAVAIRLLPWTDQERTDTVSGLAILCRMWLRR